MSPKQLKRPRPTDEHGLSEFQSSQKRSRGTEVSDKNLEMHNASFRKTDLNFAANLVQLERMRMAEIARESTPQGPGEKKQTASFDSLSKLYKRDLPTNASPQERFCTMSPINEPFTLHAREGMRASGVSEGSLEDLGLRTAASHGMSRSEDKRLQTSKWSIVATGPGEDEDSMLPCDSDEGADRMELEQGREAPRPPRRNLADTIQVTNTARMTKKNFASKKRRA